MHGVKPAAIVRARSIPLIPRKHEIAVEDLGALRLEQDATGTHGGVVAGVHEVTVDPVLDLAVAADDLDRVPLAARPLEVLRGMM
jgi:hypothetical protein